MTVPHAVLLTERAVALSSELMKWTGNRIVAISTFLVSAIANKGKSTNNVGDWISMKRLGIALLAGATVATVSTITFASASLLGVNGGTIQAGADGVACDTDGVKVNWGLETDDNSVGNVRIEGIAAACEGAKIFVKVDGGTVISKEIGSTGSESLTLHTPVAPETINGVKIWIEG